MGMGMPDFPLQVCLLASAGFRNFLQTTWSLEQIRLPRLDMAGTSVWVNLG